MIQITAKVNRKDWENPTTQEKLKRDLMSHANHELSRKARIIVSPVVEEPTKLALFTEFYILSHEDRKELLELCLKLLECCPNDKRAHTIFYTQIKPLIR